MKQNFTLAFLIFITVASSAQKKSGSDKPIRFLLGAALEFGGDDVGIVYFTDGSTQTINTGQGGTLFAGGQLQLNKSKTFFLRSSIGIKYVTTKAENANIRLTRIPLQLSVNYVPVKKLRFGVGMVTHQAIRLNFDGLGENAKFTSVPGPILEIGYGLFGLSYTLMTYKDRYQASYRANTIGITFSGVL
jgi:hypothetical protein